jgi:hypothetical protein
MLNTSAWAEIDLRVLDEIHLDSDNVRLDNEDVKVEADILADLFTNEQALALVDGITKIGWLTHEIPIAVKRKSKWVVVEGNRRVAALKAIQNPQLVPEYTARIKAMTKGVTAKELKSLAVIRVKIAPNQEQANELIAALHTTNPRKPWSPARQAAFFRAQINNGRTYAELCKRYPTVDVHDFVFRGHVLNLFDDIPYDDPELRDFVKTKTWRKQSSTLERIYQAKEFLDLTGMTMDEKGHFTTGLTDDQLKEVATVIASGIKAKSLNTRTINTVKSPRFGALMNDLQTAIGLQPTKPAPAGGSRGGTGRDSGGQQGSNGGGAGQKSGSTGGGQQGGNQSGGASGGGSGKAKQHYLQVAHLVVPDVYPTALRLHYQELSLIDVQRLPNTSYLAMRAVLEKSIKAFAEAKGEDIKVFAKIGANGYVQLHHSLVWFEAHLVKHGPKPLLQPVRKVKSGALANWGPYSSTKDAMDAANHNHNFSANPDEVLHLFDSIDPLLRELLKP